MMHPNRRRKKRPNYGLRTVEIVRGSNGFGFTISGQQPCILSCIVNNSPADQAGLRAGDFLISVNGISVSKMAHDAVVGLIGNCVGPIKMTIAENYYSDSSDEELECGRMIGRKPKYMHKPRQYRRLHKGIVVEPNEKSIAKLRDNIIKPSTSTNVYNDNADESLNISNSMPMDDEAGPIEYKALIGYLGTIEMPKQLLPSSRLQTVCSCIRKLRQEKRSPTTVLMTVLPTCLTLKNASNHIIAIYPVNRVVYIGSATDKESRYFGLVTSAVSENRGHSKEEIIDVSNSCHVFVIDSKIVDHHIHLQKAENFKIICTSDPTTESCLEFPQNALYIVNLIQTMYKLQNEVKNDQNNPLMANSPQPSASSNSDSGIGYRDDCGNVSDRILVVEFPTYRPLPIINNGNRPQGIDGADFPLNAFDFHQPNEAFLELNNKSPYKQNNFNKPEGNGDVKPMINLNNVRTYENIKNNFENPSMLLQKHNNHDIKENNRLTCRALLDNDSKQSPIKPINAVKYGDVDLGQTYLEYPIDVPVADISVKECIEDCTGNNDFKSSTGDISVQSSKSGDLGNFINVFRVPFETKKTKKQPKTPSSCENIENHSKIYHKLSPKVYGVPKTNYSCEELSNTELYEDKFCYGSLQDLSGWIEQGNPSRNIAQSEPDVRIHRNLEALVSHSEF